ncbi:MAG: DUF368 domain-containing protein [Clostridia bacterium]|nr:DUF368 domain-containing protein [Clostridia bacterium]
MSEKRGKLFFKGILIGATMSVPGASGGTMAMLLGVYEGMLQALSALFHDFRKNAAFLAFLAGGGLAGMLFVGGMVESFLFFQPFRAGCFFSGCIAGGIPFLVASSLRQAGKRVLVPLLALVTGVGIGLLLPLCPGLVRGEGMVYLALAGLLLSVALVLPGISASSFLYILGLYEPLSAAVRGRDPAFLLPLGFGCLVGSFLVARIFTRALERHPAASHLLIAGFLIASAASSLPYGMEGSLTEGILAALAGFLPLLALSGHTLIQRRISHAQLPHRPDRRRAGHRETAL